MISANDDHVPYKIERTEFLPRPSRSSPSCGLLPTKGSVWAFPHLSAASNQLVSVHPNDRLREIKSEDDRQYRHHDAERSDTFTEL